MKNKFLEEKVARRHAKMFRDESKEEAVVDQRRPQENIRQEHDSARKIVSQSEAADVHVPELDHEVDFGLFAFSDANAREMRLVLVQTPKSVVLDERSHFSVGISPRDH